MFWLCVLFFFSGFPALIYQIVWQRSLFTLYGVNIESVTMVVTAFMLGLGIGSLAGGRISNLPHVPLLAVFGFVELGIALYGLVSLRVFHAVAEFTAGGSAFQTGLVAFLLVLLPTTLMGGTLPLLTAYLVRTSGNVGRSVGVLYFVNTLGSATACFVAAKLTMRYLGESGSITVAAVVNALVGTTVLLLHFWGPRAAGEGSAVEESRTKGGKLLDFRLALVIVALVGFISLSYEILWYRLYSYITGGLARSFAYVLGFYLAGIAFGSLASRRFCRGTLVRGPQSYMRIAGVLVLTANLLSFLVAPLVVNGVVHLRYVYTLPLVALAAAMLGAVFPLMNHVSVAANVRAGVGLSYLYLSNIIGSALGSFVVGFILMDLFSFRQISVGLAILGLGAGMLVFLQAGLKAGQVAAMSAVAVLLGVGVMTGSNAMFDGMYEKAQEKLAFTPDMRFVRVVETKSGVVTVDRTGTVYGGGIYDGTFNTDLVADTNLILRLYSLSAFHPAPRDVLMIGFSSGSWGQVLVNHPQIEHVTVIEINPGYLELIPTYPQVASLLNNPKLELVIDDVRRWLLRNPDRKFDAIIMNLSYNWRAHMTNLISVEFLQLVRQHLKPGGVHFYNTTDAGEVFITGLTVFPYGLRVSNFLAVSDAPLIPDKQRWREMLLAYRIDGRPVFDLTRPDHQRRFDAVLGMIDTIQMANPPPYNGMESAESLRRRHGGLQVITDDNMGTEWRCQACGSSPLRPILPLAIGVPIVPY